jgi:hypothetical protein
MRPFPIVAAALMAAVLLGTMLDPQNWFGDKALLVVVGWLAAAFVAFNWWELWSTRDR